LVCAVVYQSVLAVDHQEGDMRCVELSAHAGRAGGWGPRLCEF
jgi:hypothetical protein